MTSFNCRDGYCGALDCETCYGQAALRYRREMAHEDHDDPHLEVDDCPECERDAHAAEWAAEAKYDQLKDDGRL